MELCDDLSGELRDKSGAAVCWFMGLECARAASVPVLSCYGIFLYWLVFLRPINPDNFSYEMPQNCNNASVPFGPSEEALGSGAWRGVTKEAAVSGTPVGNYLLVI